MDIREEISALIEANRYWEKRMDDGYMSVGSNSSEEIADALMPLVARIQEEARRRGAEIGWDKGARHVYQGGRCKFAQDGDPCPYNPYRADRQENPT